ncbi:2TM domain-containing protein [Psychroserpens sp. S379A]|uniref:2TM domain-containing protein n=1 Tax=Psychroserpens sp. S379A TaxID=3415137 RepID=UPI003C7C1D81
MKLNKDEDVLREKAKEKVQKLKVFYLHLALYSVVVILLVYNLYIVAGPYADNITALNITILVLWTAFICIHAWRVFKGSSLFNKSWEDRKTKQFLEENEESETAFWE